MTFLVHFGSGWDSPSITVLPQSTLIMSWLTALACPFVNCLLAQIANVQLDWNKDWLATQLLSGPHRNENNNVGSKAFSLKGPVL